MIHILMMWNQNIVQIDSTKEEKMDDLKTKALIIIDALTPLVMESHNCTEAKMKDLLDKYYRFAHIAVSDCENQHLDWLEELNSTYEWLEKI